MIWKDDIVIEEMSIDLETRSSVDIGKCGAYKYAESEDFTILLFAVSINGGPVTVYDLARGFVPCERRRAQLASYPRHDFCYAVSV